MSARVVSVAATILLLIAAPIIVSADNAVTNDAGRADAASDASANGRLPPEVIQRIVRASFGRFKRCYTDGLRSNPRLGGRVVTKFVIDRTGHVSQATDDPSSDLPDVNVRRCIADWIKLLEFPQPEGGIVTVLYPLIFSPGDQ